MEYNRPPSTVPSRRCASFTVTLDRPDLSRRLVLARYPRKLPAVLSVEEVGQLLEAAPGIKYRAILGAAYGAGLRVSEVASLKVDDIDSTRMLIRIEQGKGRKDRNAMLSPQLLALLRLWWKEAKQRGVIRRGHRSRRQDHRRTLHLARPVRPRQGADRHAEAAMGHLLGHGVRFGMANDVMAAGEGIETMLSLRSIMPNLPMIAALSANHLAAILFPGALRRLYVARDSDPAGDAALAILNDRAAEAGIEALSFSPALGDFNEDLLSLGAGELRASLRIQFAPQDVVRFMDWATAETG